MEIEEQLDLFRQAVEALGGGMAVSRLLAISHRNIMRLMAGQIQPHSGILADLCAELNTSIAHMVALERQLNPLFAANHAPGQREPDGRSFRHRMAADDSREAGDGDD